MEGIKEIREAQLKVEELNLKLEELKNRIVKLKVEFDDKVRPIYDEMVSIEEQIRDHYNNHVKSINIVVWKHPATGKSYLKGVFQYNVPNKSRKASATVHIGLLENFPLGKDDPKARSIGLVKAQELLKRKIFSL